MVVVSLVHHARQNMNRNPLPACRAFFPQARRLLALLLLLCGAGGAPDALAGAHTRAEGAQPALLYHNYCSVCHGDKGDGKSRAQNSLNPPPRDFTSPAAAQLSRARMIESVQNGRAGTAMTAWKGQLSQAEIASLVDYVRDTFMPAAQNADGSRGRIVYSKNCAVCHGEQGDDRSRAQASLNPPPRDFTSAAARAELTRQRMLASVTFGRADTAMAGFKTQLSNEDINAVVDYIRAGFMAQSDTSGISGVRHGRRQPAPDGSQPAPPAPQQAVAVAAVQATAIDLTAPLPRGLRGDAVKGGAFYMSNCATCHGASGDGRGPRAYFIMPKPRNFLHPAARQQFNRPALYAAISSGKQGTEMPAWSQVLDPQEIANVAEFVFQRFIAPGARPQKAGK
jgi:mono/diheme cytochrome c family protein